MKLEIDAAKRTGGGSLLQPETLPTLGTPGTHLVNMNLVNQPVQEGINVLGFKDVTGLLKPRLLPCE